jgi:DNA-binding PadR family transcriptional regulator
MYSCGVSTSYALLGILGKGPSYGYDLKRLYDALFGREKPLAYGQVYATLSRLRRDSKITADATEQEAGPERKVYAITATGRADLEAWLGVPEGGQFGAQTVLFTKVATALLLDRSPERFLDAQRTSHIARMRDLTVMRREGDLAQMLHADYALLHLEADLRWIDITAARLSTLKQEVQRAFG